MSDAHGGRFRVRSQHEQAVWNECARRVTNAVVYYNALILSEALDALEKRREPSAAAILKRASPVVWQHVNLSGRYPFDADFRPIDFIELGERPYSDEASRLNAAYSAYCIFSVAWA